MTKTPARAATGIDRAPTQTVARLPHRAVAKATTTHRQLDEQHPRAGDRVEGAGHPDETQGEAGSGTTQPERRPHEEAHDEVQPPLPGRRRLGGDGLDDTQEGHGDPEHEPRRPLSERALMTVPAGGFDGGHGSDGHAPRADAGVDDVHATTDLIARPSEAGDSSGHVSSSLCASIPSTLGDDGRRRLRPRCRPLAARMRRSPLCAMPRETPPSCPPFSGARDRAALRRTLAAYPRGMRIVSLLPSTTEILFALGAGDDVVGVTFECDEPAVARTRRIVSTSTLPEGLTPAEIDRVVAERMRAGEDLYHLDAGALADLDADLVVTQDLCAVCAVDVSVVDEALTHLGCRAEVLTIDPHSLDEVLASVVTLGRATGQEGRAREIVARQRARLAAVVASVSTATRVHALVLEWTDPPFAPGHWVPEMVTLAGGVNAIGAAGAKSVRVTWDEALAGSPEVIVAAPCGYHLDDASQLTEILVAQGVLPIDVPVWAVDANASFARPGPRLVDGVEALAAIFHPDLVGAPDPAMARRIA